MPDFAAARRMMVDGQVRTSDVTDRRLIAAMLEIPRERFVPEAQAALAYVDLDIPVTAPGNPGQARRLLRPMVLAKLIHAAEVGNDDRALDVGCATGYSSAVLAKLGRSVVALEQDPALADVATENLKLVAGPKAAVVRGPLIEGWAADAPYDVILLDGATEIEPEPLFRQLKDGGRLVAVLRRGPLGQAMLYRSVSGDVSGWPVFDAAAPLLPGFAAPPVFVF